MLEKLRGSKYAQAEKGNIFDILARDLSDKKVLFIGLPCEVNAVKNLHGKNINLYTIALICHGPTSPSVHRQYIQQIQCSECLTYFSVRYKYKGWKPYFIKAEFNNNSNFIEEFHKSTYGIAFRELKRPSCGECPFKLNYEESTINADLISVIIMALPQMINAIIHGGHLRFLYLQKKVNTYSSSFNTPLFSINLHHAKLSITIKHYIV